MRILIACDKFKGTLSAAQANAAIAKGLLDDEVQCQAIADGGEGTAALLGDALQGKAQDIEVAGPLGEPAKAQLWLVDNFEQQQPQQQPQQQSQQQRLAIFDMSSASGLQLLPVQQRNPWQASTYGTGQLLLAAQAAGADQVLLGLGGSATNDGGAGLAAALGYQFFDAQGQRLTDLPREIPQAVKIEPPMEFALPQITALSDVSNPLLGTNGATRIFGPQKGITPTDVQQHEQRLDHLATLTSQCLGTDHKDQPGAGAAGGLGFGLMSFARAKIAPGFDTLAHLLQLDRLVQQADLVITGEGSLDAQSLHGKGPAALADLARQHHKPCIAICGRTDNSASLTEHFVQVLPLVTGNAPAPAESAAALTALTSTQRATWSSWL